MPPTGCGWPRSPAAATVIANAACKRPPPTTRSWPASLDPPGSPVQPRHDGGARGRHRGRRRSQPCVAGQRRDDCAHRRPQPSTGPPAGSASPGRRGDQQWARSRPGIHSRAELISGGNAPKSESCPLLSAHSYLFEQVILAVQLFQTIQMKTVFPVDCSGSLYGCEPRRQTGQRNPNTPPEGSGPTSVPVPAATLGVPIAYALLSRRAPLHLYDCGAVSLRRVGLHPTQEVLMMYLWELGPPASRRRTWSACSTPTPQR